jgi:hypothetical protein
MLYNNILVSKEKPINYFVNNNYAKLCYFNEMQFILNIKLDNGYMTPNIWKDIEQYIPNNIKQNVKDVITNYELNNKTKCSLF